MMVHKKKNKAGMKSPARKTAAKKTVDSPRLQKKNVGVRKTRQSRIITEDIPSAYNVDTIVIMPVNVDRHFIYWEITGKLLNEKVTGKAPLKLMGKVYETETGKEIYSFEINERVGKHYMSSPVPVTGLFAEIGTVKGKKFTGLMKSNPVSSITVSARSSNHEVWMKRGRGSDEAFHVSHIEVTRISNYNPFLQKHFHELQNIFDSPFSGSSHPPKRS